MKRLLSALLAVMSAALAPQAWAQGAYPTRTVRIIVPFPPGQATDIFARMLAERLTAQWNRQVVVENRGGGGGVPGMIAGRDAAPDGYTLTMGSSGTLGINPGVYAKLPYDPVKDFAPASNLFLVPLLLIAHPSFAPRTVQDVVSAAKREPGKLVYASGGPGTSQHMTAELFRARAGIDMVHVPYRGSGPALTDVLGGQVPLTMDSLSAALNHIRAGKLEAIAVTTRERVPQLPSVPTIAESGYPGFEGVGWAGVVLPAATPREIVEKVSADVRQALADPAFRERMIERGGIPDPRTPADFAAFIRAEVAKWTQVAKTANVRLD